MSTPCTPTRCCAPQLPNLVDRLTEAVGALPEALAGGRPDATASLGRWALVALGVVKTLSAKRAFGRVFMEATLPLLHALFKVVETVFDKVGTFVRVAGLWCGV
jgi:hypothetical protein